MNSDSDQQEARTIFEAARRLTSRRNRKAYLDLACPENPALRHRIEAMLAAADQAKDRPQPARTPPPSADEDTVDSSPAFEAPGSIIGRYKLHQQLGEGGFGTVFVAEQEHPVRRRVALKVIKLGMDTKDVIARFEAERQALALMDHPGIAKVFDAGATDTGRPCASTTSRATEFFSTGSATNGATTRPTEGSTGSCTRTSAWATWKSCASSGTVRRRSDGRKGSRSVARQALRSQ